MTTKEIITLMPQIMMDVEDCPVVKTLELLNGKWTAQVFTNWRNMKRFVLEN